MKLAAQIIVTILAAGALAIPAAVACAGGPDQGMGPTPWRVARLLSGLAIIALVWSPLL